MPTEVTHPDDLKGLVLEAERRRLNDEVAIRQGVMRCRENGYSWERIGRALGVTKQAAHQRFGV